MSPVTKRFRGLLLGTIPALAVAGMVASQTISGGWLGPAGSNGQVQINNAGQLGGITIGGDATLNAATGALTVTTLGGLTPATIPSAPTTGHCVNWASATTLGDAGAACGSGGGSGRLLKLGTASLNFNIITDQSISLTGTTSYTILGVELSGCSGSGFGTAAGAFYTAASKTGSLLFGSTTTTQFSRVTATAGSAAFIAAGGLPNNNSVVTQIYTGPTTAFLSLTTPSGATATCNATVIGIDLS